MAQAEKTVPNGSSDMEKVTKAYAAVQTHRSEVQKLENDSREAERIKLQIDASLAKARENLKEARAYLLRLVDGV